MFTVKDSRNVYNVYKVGVMLKYSVHDNRWKVYSFDYVSLQLIGRTQCGGLTVSFLILRSVVRGLGYENS